MVFKFSRGKKETAVSASTTEAKKETKQWLSVRKTKAPPAPKPEKAPRKPFNLFLAGKKTNEATKPEAIVLPPVAKAPSVVPEPEKEEPQTAVEEVRDAVDSMPSEDADLEFQKSEEARSEHSADKAPSREVDERGLSEDRSNDADEEPEKENEDDKRDTASEDGETHQRLVEDVAMETIKYQSEQQTEATEEKSSEMKLPILSQLTCCGGLLSTL